MDVSIVVTTYNYARFIDECLNSCLNQKGANLKFEVIVVDDGSIDDTPLLLASRNDSRLRVFRIDNGGVERASNYGFALAQGRFIVRVDADDVLDSNYLAGMSSFLNQDFGFLYSDYNVIDSSSVFQEAIKLPDFDPAEVMTRGDFLATGTMYPAELLRSYGGYSTATRNSGLENYELITKLIASGIKGIHVAVPLFNYRRHQINMSATRTASIVAYGQNLFERNCLGKFQTNQYHPYKLVLANQTA
jgi:glycosyltransferase involved in cell wall biosynthesis